MPPGSRLASGAAWRAWCERLAALGDRILGADFPADPRARAEGFRALTRLLVYATQMEMEAGDPAYPVFYRYEDPRTPWGGPNPDNVYHRATIDPAATYRVTADVRGVRSALFSLHEGDMQLGEYGVYSERSLDALAVGQGGRLELVLSPEPQPGNWIPMHRAARLFMIRVYLADWERDAAPGFDIVRVGAEGEPPPPLAPAAVERALDRAATWVERSVVFWNGYLTKAAERLPPNVAAPPRSAPGGAEHLLYGSAMWDLGPDEALVVECRDPACRLPGLHDPHARLVRIGRLREPPDQLERRAAPRRPGRVLSARPRAPRPGRAELDRHRRASPRHAHVPADPPDRRPRAARARRPLGELAGALPAGHPRVAPARAGGRPARGGAPRSGAGTASGVGTPARPAWLERLIAHGAAAGGAERLVPLDGAELEAEARRSTGLDDFGGETWRASYDVLVSALERESRLHLGGRLVARAELLRSLRNRLQLADLWRRRPEILAAPVAPPIFVVGAPRTGHVDPPGAPGVRSGEPRARDVGDAPSGRVARRRRRCSRWATRPSSSGHDLQPEYEAMHANSGDAPERVHLHHDERVPLRSVERMPCRAELRRAPAAGRPPRRVPLPPPRAPDAPAARTRAHRWVLKAPSHLGQLRALFAVYPEARIVHTHRDPLKCLPSALSLMGTLKWMRCEAVDLAPAVAGLPRGYAAMFRHEIEQRASGALPDERFLDVRYDDLMRDPIGTVAAHLRAARAAARRGREKAMVEHLARRPQGAHGPHRYDLATFEPRRRRRSARRSGSTPSASRCPRKPEPDALSSAVPPGGAMKFGLAFANVGPFGLPDHGVAPRAHRRDVRLRVALDGRARRRARGLRVGLSVLAVGRMPGTEEMPIPDPLIWLAYIAAATERIRLATGIVILPQRHPSYLAKEVATLDQLSKGRAILGVGIGWLREEFDALGIPFEERAARTDEICARAAHALERGAAALRGQVLPLEAVALEPEAGAAGRPADRGRRPHEGVGAARRARRRRLVPGALRRRAVRRPRRRAARRVRADRPRSRRDRAHDGASRRHDLDAVKRGRGPRHRAAPDPAARLRHGRRAARRSRSSRTRSSPRRDGRGRRGGVTMRVRVLGSAAGGGLPQWNCGCANCVRARAGDPAVPPRTQPSLAVSADGARWSLAEREPDVREQLARAPALHPRPGHARRAARHGRPHERRPRPRARPARAARGAALPHRLDGLGPRRAARPQRGVPAARAGLGHA